MKFSKGFSNIQPRKQKWWLYLKKEWGGKNKGRESNPKGLHKIVCLEGKKREWKGNDYDTKRPLILFSFISLLTSYHPSKGSRREVRKPESEEPAEKEIVKGLRQWEDPREEMKLKGKRAFCSGSIAEGFLMCQGTAFSLHSDRSCQISCCSCNPLLPLTVVHPHPHTHSHNHQGHLQSSSFPPLRKQCLNLIYLQIGC